MRSKKLQKIFMKSPKKNLSKVNTNQRKITRSMPRSKKHRSKKKKLLLYIKIAKNRFINNLVEDLQMTRDLLTNHYKA